MIITTASHGRTIADCHRLGRHLSKTVDQAVRIVASKDVSDATDLGDALEDVRRFMAMNTRSKVGFQHLSLNPTTEITDHQIRVTVAMIIHELAAKNAPWILVEHRKPRTTTEASVHYHLVLAQIGSDGRGIDVHESYSRLEAIARIVEFSWGEPLTVGRHPYRISDILRRMEHPEVAKRLIDLADERKAPRSSMTTKTRARAERAGLDLPRLRKVVAEAWTAPDPISCLANQGLTVARGEKPCVWLVSTDNGHLVGAVDRLVHAHRGDVDSRLTLLMSGRRAVDAGTNSWSRKDGTERRTDDDHARPRASRRDQERPEIVRRDAIDRVSDPRHLVLVGGGNPSTNSRAHRSESGHVTGNVDDFDAARSRTRRRARALIVSVKPAPFRRQADGSRA